jgi:2-polyprenyl-3-methyl-5-hydroxy-6-metoxy-1,4-benzoquinol methylase
MEQIFLKNKLVVPKCPDGPGENGNGVHSFIYRGEEVNKIAKKYGRDNCCLKILKNNEKFQENIKKQWWGQSTPFKGSHLNEAVLIQNIYAFHNLAPRVYAVMQVKSGGRWYWAMLEDDLGNCVPDDNKQIELIKLLKEVGEKYNISVFDDGVAWNVVNGKYVDFQGFHLPNNYEEQLKQRITGIASIGRWGPWQNYQPIEELKITGGRDMKHRKEVLNLKQIPFGSTILDVGCSEGSFCRYLSDRGAKRVVGIDLPGVVEAAMEWSYYKGYYNIDFFGYDLLKEIPQLGKFDVILFLSMGHHIGLPDWVIESTNDLLIFEGNGKDDDASLINKIGQKFDLAIEMGFTNDLFKRPVIWAYK